MKQIHVYKVDLTETNGNGDLSCPQCGKVNKHGLEEVVIRCNRCTSQIHLGGFYVLQNLP